MKARDRDRLHDRLGLLTSHLRSLTPEIGRDAPVDADGRRVFVSCLAEDTVHDAIRLVNQAGGSAMVLAFDLSSKKHLSVTAGTFTLNETHGDGDCSLPVGPTTTLGHLFSILTPGASMTLTMDGDAMCIDKRDEQSVDPKAASLAGV